MKKLLQEVFNRCITSFIDIIPKMAKDRSLPYKVALYIGAAIVYTLVLVVLITVVIAVFSITIPISLIYTHNGPSSNIH